MSHLTLDREAFAAAFGRESIAVRHDLAGHELFSRGLSSPGVVDAAAHRSAACRSGARTGPGSASVRRCSGASGTSVRYRLLSIIVPPAAAAPLGRCVDPGGSGVNGFAARPRPS